MTAPTQKTVLFITMNAFGHLYPAVAIAEQLVALGHRAVFAVEQSWKGKVSSFAGLEEALYVDPNRKEEQAGNAKNEQSIAALISNFPYDGIEKRKRMKADNSMNNMRSMLPVEDEFKRIIALTKPNVIVVDHFATIPAVFHSRIHWVKLWVSAPLSEVHQDSANVPPGCSGLPTKGNREEWAEFRKLSDLLYAQPLKEFHTMLQTKYNIPIPPAGHWSNDSPSLNIYPYPEELDYLDVSPLPAKWQRFDHFVRIGEIDATFKMPTDLINSKNGKLIYVSLGTMGCMDVELMKRLIGIASKSPNRFIFSLGPQAEQLSKLLTSNMFGAKFLPQTHILPLVDLVITHGGNNSVLESLYFGKPMIVCPLFADQPENAQRVTEVGFGQRINPYKCTPEQFLNTIEQLLHNIPLKEQLEKLSHKMQQSQAQRKTAQAILAISN